MLGDGAKLPRRKEEAIAALLAQPSVVEAARVIGIGPQTLGRWMKDPLFDSAYRAAKRAEYRQSMARLGQWASVAIKSILRLMYQGKKPATRLKAARDIIRLAKEGQEIEDFAAALAQAERIVKAAEAGSLPAGERARSPIKGHGEKLSRKKAPAIAALLGQRNIAEAARTVKIARQTLDRWMQEPAFIGEYAAAAVAVFGPAMMLAQQHVGTAVTLIKNFAVDRAIPEEIQLQADLYITNELKANVLEHLSARAAVLDPVNDSGGEPPVTSKTIGRSLHQSLQRIKARLSDAREQRGIGGIIFVHAIDGNAAGTSVRGPDGGYIWLDPPAGFEAGEAVPKQDGSAQDQAG
jgi:hypothetical protein